MMQTPDSGRDPHRTEPSPSLFKYFVGASALLIAGCSAFFSVWGLGLLFVGSATAVMVMAASLEVGKLVGASFLYRYWDSITLPFKIYLTLAILALIGITSLGNYGYLARAYERTHMQIGMLESQIANIEKEITDTQRQIDGSRGQLAKATDVGREDITKLQQRLTEANEALSQSLVRIQDRRKVAQERRDRDIQVPMQLTAEQAEVVKKGIASEESAIAELNARVAVLDRAVDAYTKLGGPGFFKEDGIKKGQQLRVEQSRERDTINAGLGEHRRRMEGLQAQLAKQAEAADLGLAAVRDQFAQEISRLDAEEQALRRSHADSVARTEQQVAALQSQGRTTLAADGTQVESHYQRIRARNEEIQQLRERIAAVDIGSYRFVARAFEAPADDIVKWLMLALVLVFDPFAVSLMIGFNVALLRDRPRRRPAGTIVGETDDFAVGVVAASGRRSRWAVAAISVLAVALATGAMILAGHWGMKALHATQKAAHARLIPPDSFAVLTFRPGEFSPAAQDEPFTSWLGRAVGKAVSDSMAELLQSGLDPHAPIYAFAKFPSKRAAEDSDRPVMLCGVVARVTDQSAAEAALSRIAAQMASSLGASPATAPSPARGQAMIRCGPGRYLDPEGGFFSFGLTEHAAVMMIEFEGDPQSPCVENEIKLWLARSEAEAGTTSQARGVLPPRALNHDGAIALWLDAGRFFSALPKNPTAQAHYEQLQQRLGFDLVLTMHSDGTNQVQVAADYDYQFDRFKAGEPPGEAQVAAAPGSADGAGLAGRLMDRCLDTLDYNSLIERLRLALGNSKQAGAQQVKIEKSFASARDAQFILRAPYDAAAGPPVLTAVEKLFP